MRKHKLLAVLLALAMTISLLPTAAAAESSYRDTDGHWAETAIDRWSGYGIIQGNNGAFNPNGALTRAHMAAILTRLLGLPAADSAGFTDVDEGAWYAEYINRCAAAGIMLGANGKASPNALITRQQAMVMLARALGIQPVRNPDLSGFRDGGAVSEYARGYVAAMIEAGIVGGVSADTLGCGSNITRAATVTILDRAITTYANRPDSRVEAVSGGIVLVAADGVELTGSADSVLVAQGAADGTVTLDGVTADSLLVLAENSTVVLDGNSRAKTVTVAEAAEGAQVVVEEDAKVTTVVSEAPESKVSVSGQVGDVVTAESAREAAVEVAKGGRVDEITAAGEKTDIAVSGKVENVTVGESAEDTTVEAGAGGVISKVDNAAEGTTVSGKGKVESVTTSGDNTTVTTKGTEVEVEKGTTGTTAGGKDVAGGTTVTTPGSSGGSSSGGSSSGGGSSKPPAQTYYTVTFKNGEETVSTQSVVSGGKATAVTVDAPDAYSELRWMNGDTEWNFDTAVTGDVTLAAAWVWNGKADETWGTDGTYSITAPQELAQLANLVNAGESFEGETVTLEQDIDLNNQDWTPIGKKDKTFKGTFEGKKHVISNLFINKNVTNLVSDSDMGLFGFTEYPGKISDLTVKNAKITAGLDVGVVAGTPYTAQYNNITVTGKVYVHGNSYVGGMFGKNLYASASNLVVDVTPDSYVRADSGVYRSYVGGVVGFMGEGGHVVSHVRSNIDVSGSTCDVGGITGIAHYGNQLLDCVCTGDVEIRAYNDEGDHLEIGGIAGVWMNSTSGTVTITGSFTGKLSSTKSDGTVYDGEFEYGGLVGRKYYPASEAGTLTLNGEVQDVAQDVNENEIQSDELVTE